MSKLPAHLAAAYPEIGDYHLRMVGFLPILDIGFETFQNVAINRIWHKEVDDPNVTYTEHEEHTLMSAPRAEDGAYHAIDCDCADHRDPRRHYRTCRHMFFYDVLGGLIPELDITDRTELTTT